jgi:hypothetical protein
MCDALKSGRPSTRAILKSGTEDVEWTDKSLYRRDRRDRTQMQLRLAKSTSIPTMSSNTYLTNIIPGFNPDPSIVRVGDDYFIVTSSFEYFPALPIYHSTDLVSWKLIGHGLTRKSQLDMRTVEAGGGIYAPTLRYHKGRFYIACGTIYRCRVETLVRQCLSCRPKLHLMDSLRTGIH